MDGRIGIVSLRSQLDRSTFATHLLGNECSVGTVVTFAVACKGLPVYGNVGANIEGRPVDELD